MLVCPAHHRQRRHADAEREARALGVDAGRQRELHRRAVDERSRHGVGPRVIVGLHGHTELDGVGVARAGHVEAEGRAVARLAGHAEGEAHFAPASRLEARLLDGLPLELDARAARLHAHGRRAAGALVHDGAGAEVVAGAHEPRQRRPCHERPGHEERRLPAPETIPRRHRHRHHAERGQVVRQLGRHGRPA